jgi:hypothetical protein
MFDARYLDHSEAKEPATGTPSTSRDGDSDAKRASSGSCHQNSRRWAKSGDCGEANIKIHDLAVEAPSFQNDSRGALFDLWKRHVSSEEPAGSATTSALSLSPSIGPLFSVPPKPDTSCQLPQHSIETGSVKMDGYTRADHDPPIALLLHDGGQFGGIDQPVRIPHDPIHSTKEGTWAVRFIAYNPGNAQRQTLFSKEGRGCQAVGHLWVYICRDGELVVGFRGKDGDAYLCYSGIEIEPNESCHLAIAFSEAEIRLFLNGERLNCEVALPGVLAVSCGDLMLGACVGSSNELQWHFNGEISNVLLLNRPVSETEALFLFEADGKIDGIDMLYGIELEDIDYEETAETGRPATRIKLNKPLQLPRQKASKELEMPASPREAPTRLRSLKAAKTGGGVLVSRLRSMVFSHYLFMAARSLDR